MTDTKWTEEQRNQFNKECAIKSHKDLVLKAIERAANARLGTEAAIEQHYHDTRVRMGYECHQGTWIYPDQDKKPVAELPKYTLRDELARLRSLDALTQSDKARCYDIMIRIEVIDNEELDQWEMMHQLIG